jgi:hypothetical protein
MRRRCNRIEAGVAADPDGRNASVLFLASAAAMLLTTTLAVPAFAVLPLVASVALIGAALVSLVARWPTFKDDRSLLADFAGACAFVGVAAAIFSRPTQVLATVALLVP